MQLGVDPDDVAGRSVPVGLVGNVVSAIDLAADLSPLAAAVPGGATARSLAEVSARWTDGVERVRSGATSQADSLAAAAREYTSSESQARGAFAARYAVRGGH